MGPLGSAGGLLSGLSGSQAKESKPAGGISGMASKMGLGGLASGAQAAPSQAEAGSGGRSRASGPMGLQSILGGAALPARTGPAEAQRPRGWDRPPFEVGAAVKRHLIQSQSSRAAQPEQARKSQLEDFGLSVIDLEEKGREAIDYVQRATSDEGGMQLDDATIDEIYFRLKRILETETERMGGEA